MSRSRHMDGGTRLSFVVLPSRHASETCGAHEQPADDDHVWLAVRRLRPNWFACGLASSLVAPYGGDAWLVKATSALD